MRVENCNRYGAEIRGERKSYDFILRHYICNKCGGRLTHRFSWDEELQRSVDLVACARCGSREVISESRYEKQVSDAIEAEYVEREWIRRTGMGLLDVIEQGRKGRTERNGIVRLGWTEPYADGTGEKPVASDHFVLTDAPVLADIFGEEPSSLPIRFPHAKFDENILASYMVWAGGRNKGSGICLCEGDGKKVISALPFTTRVNQNSGRVSVNRGKGDRRVSYGKAAIDFAWDAHSFVEGDVVPCPGSAGGLYTHCEACNPSILLKIQIRDPRIASYGYWQITTRSINNYLHLMQSWDDITKDGKLDIPMSMVPFILSIKPGATLFQNQKDKSWGKRDAFYLNLAVDPASVPLLQEFQGRRFVELMQGWSPDPAPQLEATNTGDSEGPEWEEGEFEDAESEPEPEPTPPPHRASKKQSFKTDAIQAVVNKGYAENGAGAYAMLNLSEILVREDSVNRIVAWAALFDAQQKKGVEPYEAALAADKMLGKKE